MKGIWDPCVFFGSDETITARTGTMLKRFGTQNYIANLGHGMLPEHEPRAVATFVDTVHTVSKKMNGEEEAQKKER